MVDPGVGLVVPFYGVGRSPARDRKVDPGVGSKVGSGEGSRVEVPGGRWGISFRLILSYRGSSVFGHVP